MNQNNECLNYPCTQCYLKGNIVCNAKRTEKSACFLRGTPVDTLCWNAPDSAFLSKTESQRVASVSSSFRSLLSQLSKYDVNVIFPEIRLESSAKNRKTQITQKREFVSDLMIVFIENRKNIDPIALYWGLIRETINDGSRHVAGGGFSHEWKTILRQDKDPAPPYESLLS